MSVQVVLLYETDAGNLAMPITMPAPPQLGTIIIGVPGIEGQFDVDEVIWNARREAYTVRTTHYPAELCLGAAKEGVKALKKAGWRLLPDVPG
jgi:hypothetical protein